MSSSSMLLDLDQDLDQVSGAVLSMSQILFSCALTDCEEMGHWKDFVYPPPHMSSLQTPTNPHIQPVLSSSLATLGKFPDKSGKPCHPIICQTTNVNLAISSRIPFKFHQICRHCKLIGPKSFRLKVTLWAIR